MTAYMEHFKGSGLMSWYTFGGYMECKLEIQGWQRLEPTRKPGGEPGRCFIAMSFEDGLDACYFEGIQPAVETDWQGKAIRFKGSAAQRRHH
jgi:hypothetical protein